MKDEILSVAGCPICDLWDEENFGNEEFKKKLIHVSDSFIVLKYNGEIVIASRNHIMSVDKGTWGRMLKYVRHEFGFQARILFDDERSKRSVGLPSDHFAGVIRVPVNRWER